MCTVIDKPNLLNIGQLTLRLVTRSVLRRSSECFIVGSSTCKLSGVYGMCQLLGLPGRCNVPILAIFKMHMQPPTNLEFTIKSLKSIIMSAA